MIRKILFYTAMWFFVCFGLSVMMIHGQTNILPILPADPGIPVGKEAIWLAIIPPATFTITWLFGKIPQLPKAILPWITPLIGIAIGAVMEYATGQNWPWWSQAGAGAIATTIYEAAKGTTGAGPASSLTPTETGRSG